jgi:hypothetical protein
MWRRRYLNAGERGQCALTDGFAAHVIGQALGVFSAGKAILSIDTELSRLFDHQLDISSMAGVVGDVAGAVSGPVFGDSSITRSHPVT